MNIQDLCQLSSDFESAHPALAKDGWVFEESFPFRNGALVASRQVKWPPDGEEFTQTLTLDIDLEGLVDPERPLFFEYSAGGGYSCRMCDIV